jgi:hypothetical protein
MHEFCQVLQESVQDILKDESTANAVAQGFDEILSIEHTEDDPRQLFDRILEVVLRHPIISSRFRRFIITDAVRSSQRPQVDQPSLQELFDSLRLVKNAIILKKPITWDDVAAEIYSQPETKREPEDAPNSDQPKGSSK